MFAAWKFKILRRGDLSGDCSSHRLSVHRSGFRAHGRPTEYLRGLCRFCWIVLMFSRADHALVGPGTLVIADLVSDWASSFIMLLTILEVD